jgi:hypothetical protein
MTLIISAQRQKTSRERTRSVGIERLPRFFGDALSNQLKQLRSLLNDWTRERGALNGWHRTLAKVQPVRDQERHTNVAIFGGGLRGLSQGPVRSTTVCEAASIRESAGLRWNAAFHDGHLKRGLL